MKKNREDAAHVSGGPEATVHRRCSEGGRRRLSGAGSRRLDVGRRRRLVEAGRQAEAMVNLDLEGHATLALDTVFGVGEVVVGSLDDQWNRYGQRLLELLVAPVVLERVVVLRVVNGAAQVGGVVGGLDHRHVRIRIENCTKFKVKKKKEQRKLRNLMVLENVDWKERKESCWSWWGQSNFYEFATCQE